MFRYEFMIEELPTTHAHVFRIYARDKVTEQVSEVAIIDINFKNIVESLAQIAEEIQHFLDINAKMKIDFIMDDESKRLQACQMPT